MNVDIIYSRYVQLTFLFHPSYFIDILERVKAGPQVWPFRPDVNLLKCDAFIVKCLMECWQEEPESRPDFKYIRIRLKPMQRGL